MFALRHNLDLAARTRPVTVYGALRASWRASPNGRLQLRALDWLDSLTRNFASTGAAQRMATQTSNGLVKSWVAQAERAAAMQERADSLTTKAADTRGMMSSLMRSSTPMLLTDSHDEDDSPRDYAEGRKGQGDCAACRGKHRAHTCSLASRSAEHNLRKLGQEEDNYSDDDGLTEEQAMHASSAFADRMQDYMREQNVSQTELGQQIGLRQQQISRWIFGKGTTATRQAVERRIRAWLKKRSIDLEDIVGKDGAGGDAAASAGARAAAAASSSRDKVASSKPSLMHGSSGGGGKKRKEMSLDADKLSNGVRAGGRRARLADTPADAYANDFAHTLHKYIKQVGLSQEALGKATGLRQQQISSYMFQKCSESMHQLVEQTLRKWVVKEKIDLPGFTTAQLKSKPIPWRPRHRLPKGKSAASAASRKASGSAADESEELDGSSMSEDEDSEHLDRQSAASASAFAGAEAELFTRSEQQAQKKQKGTGRSYYCSGNSQRVSLSRRPVSKAQAMAYARLAAERQEPVRLPLKGAFVVPPRQASQHGDGDGGSPAMRGQEVGVDGAVLHAQEGGIVDVQPGRALFTPGGRMKVAYDGEGGVTMMLVAPLMQVAAKAQQQQVQPQMPDGRGVAQGSEAGEPTLDSSTAQPLDTSGGAQEPTRVPEAAEGHAPPTLEQQQQQQQQQQRQEEDDEEEMGAGASAAAATSPSSEPGDEPSESKRTAAAESATGTGGGSLATAAAAAAGAGGDTHEVDQRQQQNVVSQLGDEMTLIMT